MIHYKQVLTCMKIRKNQESRINLMVIHHKECKKYKSKKIWEKILWKDYYNQSKIKIKMS